MAVVLLATGCLEDPELGTDQREVVGPITTDFPAVGQLLMGETAEVAGAKCTGTLIGCDVFLTAAHCVCADDEPDCDTTADAGRHTGQVFFQHAGFIPVAEVRRHPEIYDIAVLTLARPVSGIEPAGVGAEPVAPGTPGVAVGFGRLGGSDFERGIKRVGEVSIEDCTLRACRLSGTAALCNGDSGGPTLQVGADGVDVIGVHSTGGDGCYDIDEKGYAGADTMTVSAEARDFIMGMLETRSATTTCDAPHLGEPTVKAESGRLEVGESAEFTIEVPPGTAELRVALNSTDLVIPAGEAGHGTRLGPDLDLRVRTNQVLEPQTDCVAAGTSPNGYCEFRSPSPGSWVLSVSAKEVGTDQGGDFQLTTTLFSGAPLASSEHYQVAADRALSIDTAGGLLSNDNQDSGPLSAVLDDPPLYGAVQLSSDGSFTYVPDAGYRGPDSFSYRASNGPYRSSATLVTLIVHHTAEENRIGGGCSATGRTASTTAALLLGVLFIGTWRRRSSRPQRRARAILFS